MKRHLNVMMPDELLADLDDFAIKRGINRSEATRLIIEYWVGEPEDYTPPAQPSWQTEAWTALLRGIYGDTRLVLTADIKVVLRLAVAALNERDRQVLRLRFGLNGPRHTGAEVAAAMGWDGGRQRAHQVERVALRRVRGWCRARGIWDLLKEQLNEEEAR